MFVPNATRTALPTVFEGDLSARVSRVKAPPGGSFARRPHQLSKTESAKRGLGEKRCTAFWLKRSSRRNLVRRGGERRAAPHSAVPKVARRGQVDLHEGEGPGVLGVAIWSGWMFGLRRRAGRGMGPGQRGRIDSAPATEGGTTALGAYLVRRLVTGLGWGMGAGQRARIDSAPATEGRTTAFGALLTEAASYRSSRLSGRDRFF